MYNGKFIVASVTIKIQIKNTNIISEQVKWSAADTIYVS